MKRLPMIMLICLLTAPAPVWAGIQNMLVTSGRIDSQHRFQRAVFFIEVPETYTEALYVRIFDADLGGMYDRRKNKGKAHYYIYGKSAVDRQVRNYADPLPSSPLFSLSLGESRHYDNRWRSIKKIVPSDGEPYKGRLCFQLITEVDSALLTNKYKVFISSREKRNEAVEGVRLTSPVVSLQLPADKSKITQLRMQPPGETEILQITNFDADKNDFGTRLFFETPHRSRHVIEASRNSAGKTSRIVLSPEEKGQECAIVISSREVNYISLWVSDEATAEPVMIELPPFISSINRLPLPKIETVQLSDCTTVVLDASGTTDPDGDDLFFTWFFEDGSVQHGKRILYDFLKTGHYTVKLEVRDSSGLVANRSRAQTGIDIIAPPRPEMAAPDRGAPGEALSFKARLPEDAIEKNIVFDWDFGDGQRIRGESVNHRYILPGRYTISLAASRPGREICSRQSVSQSVWINSSPVTSFRFKPVIAAGESVLLDASESTDSDGEIVHYEWSVNGHIIGDGEQISHQWETPGSYTIALKITDDAGLGNSVVQEETVIRVNAPPLPVISAPVIGAAGENIEFDAGRSTDPDDSIIAYRWDFGDGNGASTERAFHSYSAPGTYDVTLTVTDGSEVESSRATAGAGIRINHPPTADAGSDRRINGSVAAFDGSGSADPDDEIIMYEWAFGDGETGTGKKTSHMYTHPGDYQVILTVTDGSGSLSARAADTMALSINHLPVADAGSDRTIAVGERALFNAGLSSDPDGDITGWKWEIDGKTFDAGQAEHLFEKAGRFQALLTVTDNDGATALDHSVITVNSAPSPAFEVPLRAAPGEAVLFDAGQSEDADGDIRQFTWDFGDGSPSATGSSVRHTYTASGRYSVTLTAEDDSTASNRSVSVTHPVAVNYPPSPRAGSDVDTCDQTIRFDASASTDPDGDGLSCLWEFGDGQAAEGAVVVHQYEKPGVYPVLLTVDDGNGLSNSKASSSLTVAINGPPTPVIRANRFTSCTGEAVLFDAGGSGDPENSPLLYQWDLGDGNPVEEINPVKVYTLPGVYRVMLTVMDDSGLPCDTASAEALVHVIDGPLARAGEDMETCANAMVSFDGSRSSGGSREIKSYEWEFGDGVKGVGITPMHVYSRPGEYKVRLRIKTAGEGTACGTESEDQLLIRVKDAPKADFTVAPEVCIGETFTCDAGPSFSALGPIKRYSWDFGDQNTAQGKTVTHHFDTPGVYEIHLKIETEGTAQCNEAELARKIRVNQPPASSFQMVRAGKVLAAEGAAARAGDIIRFNALKSRDPDGWITEYNWSFGDGDTGTGAVAEHVYKEAGEMTVRLAVKDNSRTKCLESVFEVPLLVSLPRLLPIEGPDTVCMNHEAVFTVPGGGETTLWQTGNGDTFRGARLEYVFGMPGSYQVLARVDDEWTAPRQVRVLPPVNLRVPESISVYAGETFRISPVYASFYKDRLRCEWTSGDGVQSPAIEFEHRFTEPGTRQVQLSVTDGEGILCLAETRDIEVKVLPRPEVEIRVSPGELFSGGARDEVTFEAVLKEKGTPWRYQWEMGDGQTRSGRKVRHIYTAAGSFTVTVDLSDPLGIAGQTYSFTKEIDVHAGNQRTE